MKFSEASQFVMPFGKYKGRTLDGIASEDDGLRYLDWLRGSREGSHTDVDNALEAYLDDLSIKKELENLL